MKKILTILLSVICFNSLADQYNKTGDLQEKINLLINDSCKTEEYKKYLNFISKSLMNISGLDNNDLYVRVKNIVDPLDIYYSQAVYDKILWVKDLSVLEKNTTSVNIARQLVVCENSIDGRYNKSIAGSNDRYFIKIYKNAFDSFDLIKFNGGNAQQFFDELILHEFLHFFYGHHSNYGTDPVYLISECSVGFSKILRQQGVEQRIKINKLELNESTFKDTCSKYQKSYDFYFYIANHWNFNKGQDEYLNTRMSYTKKALEINPKSVEALNLLAELQLKSNNSVDAINTLRKLKKVYYEAMNFSD